MMVSGSVLQTPAYVQVMLLGPVNESTLHALHVVSQHCSLHLCLIQPLALLQDSAGALQLTIINIGTVKS